MLAADAPERIEDARQAGATRVARQTFGLGPALVALALIAAAAELALTPGRAAIGAAEIVALAVLFGGAVASVAHDVRRRARRVEIVALGDALAVYREGKLAGTVAADDLAALHAREPFGARGVLVLVMAGVLFFGYGLTESGGLGARALALGPGAWILALAASFARDALLCARLDLPGGSSPALFVASELDPLLRAARRGEPAR